MGEVWVEPSVPHGMVRFMTEHHNVLAAELRREELDEEWLAEKLADRPDLPPEELTPTLWTVALGWNGYTRQYEESAKDYQLAALVGSVLAEASLGRGSVSWTLSGTPPEGGTVADAVDALGVRLYEQWPSEWG